MNLVQTLKKARRFLAGGWVNNPFGHCASSDGTTCSWDDEGVSLFSVHGALKAAADEGDARAVLEGIVAPAYVELMQMPLPPADDQRVADLMWGLTFQPIGLDDWLRRTSLVEVLATFDMAILRATRGDA